MIFDINGLALSLGAGEGLLKTKAASLLGVPEEAIADLTRVVERAPDYARAQYQLALAYARGIVSAYATRAVLGARRVAPPVRAYDAGHRWAPGVRSHAAHHLRT